MARLDVEEYRRMILKKVEERVMANKDKIPHFTTKLLHDALMTEMNRADAETWEVEIPDDTETAIKEAEKRVLEFMEKNIDLGVGKSY